MSNYAGIDKTLRKALSDMALGYKMVLENENFDPTTLTADVWLEVFQLPAGTTSMMKTFAGAAAGSRGADENTGIFQVSILSKNINDGPAEVVGIADLLANEFYHGKQYDDFEDVFIQGSDRNAGRIDGGFYRIDISVNWTSYVDR